MREPAIMFISSCTFIEQCNYLAQAFNLRRCSFFAA